jgi:hypothetical protein
VDIMDAKMIVLGVVALLVVIAFLSMLPDLIRYIKISSM